MIDALLYIIYVLLALIVMVMAWSVIHQYQMKND